MPFFHSFTLLIFILYHAFFILTGISKNFRHFLVRQKNQGTFNYLIVLALWGIFNLIAFALWNFLILLIHSYFSSPSKSPHIFTFRPFVTYSPLFLSHIDDILYLVIKMDIKEKFGKQIKKERTKLGLSQESFALLCDLDRTYIASIENGKRNVSLLNIEKICTALNYSLSDFFKQMEVQ